MNFTVATAYKQALENFNQGCYTEVESLCEAILEAVPNHLDAINLLGVVAQKMNRHDLAINEFGRAINIDGSKALLYFNLAISMQQLGQSNNALENLNIALKLEPDNQQIKQYLNEITVGDEGKSSEQKSQEALDIGVSLHMAGQLEPAMEFYQKSLGFKADNVDAISNLGFALQAKGEITKALQYYQKAIAIKPDYELAYCNLGFALTELGRTDEAITNLKKAIGINKNYAQAYYNLANALQIQNRLDEAIYNFQKAIALKPDYLEAHYNLGNAYKLQDRANKAIASYKQAIELDPTMARLYINLAVVLREVGRLEEGVDSLKTAIAIDPKYAQAYNNLGVTLKEQGLLDEAVTNFNKAISVKPDYAEAYSNLAASKKYKNIDDIENMVAVLSQLTDDGDKIHLNFALGKAMADIENYDESFNYYLAGNRLKRATLQFDIGQLSQKFAQYRQIFSDSFFQNRNYCANLDETPIFVLGMPRSGSSLIEQILSSHKDVHGGGELPFLKQIITTAFDGDFSDASILLQPDQAVKLGNKYLEQIRELAPDAKYIVDKMPHNFMFIGFIKLLLPKAKIIHSVRSAKDTCLSIFRANFVDSHEYAYDLKELGEYYRLYLAMMNHWQSLFPNTIYSCHYEKLTHDQEGETRNLLNFCGLDWSDECLRFYESVRDVRTASDFQVRQKMYVSSVDGWKRFEKHLQPLLKALADRH
ncbi:MAG: tetratricopeptide repeat protein [Magnetococcales bacterium]|nr:tetratricopeptide repeat protein [Magnetococcales bacterium]